MHFIKQSFDHHTNFFESDKSSNLRKDFIYHRQIEINTNHTQTLFHFDVPVKITPLHGLSLLVLQSQDHSQTIFQYLVESTFVLAKNIPFNILGLSQSAKVDLATQTKEDPTYIRLEREIVAQESTPLFQVSNILSAATINFQEEFLADYVAQDHYELLIVEQGSLKLAIHHQKSALTKGQVMVIPPNVTSKRQHLADHHTKVHSIRFNATNLSKEITLTPFDGQGLISPVIDRMYQDNHSPLFASQLLAQVITLLIALEVRANNHEQTRATLPMRDRYESELFNQILAYIHESETVDIKVADLVSRFNISRSTLQQLFNKFEHTTPKIYINQLRLEKSRQLIRESNLSITEIANLLGYGSIQYFSRAFSKQYHMSPSEYAKGYAKRM